MKFSDTISRETPLDEEKKKLPNDRYGAVNVITIKVINVIYTRFGRFLFILLFLLFQKKIKNSRL